MNPLIELKSVTVGYDRKSVLDNVNLTIYPDSFIGVIGPNGGGKTTLVKLILGILKPVKGQIIKNFHSAKRKPIGYLPQNSSIDYKFPISVMEVVLTGLLDKTNVTGRYKKTEKRKANELMKQVGISELKDKPVGELSGGQMQRVLLARALISSPELLILDEPDTFVDNQFENELYQLLKDLQDDMAILLVSHDIGTISYYVKSIACVNRTVYYHPSNVITEQQLASYNCPIQLITHGTVPHQVLKKH